jgi:hypothetical protein
MAPHNHRRTRLQLAAASAAVAGFAAWQWLAPRLEWALAMGQTLAVRAGRWALSHRGLVVGLGVRVAWWAALGLLLWGSRLLVSLAPQVDGLPQEVALQAFMGGLALCALGVMLAPSRSVRWLSSAQGVMHAWCGLVAWISLGG